MLSLSYKNLLSFGIHLLFLISPSLQFFNPFTRIAEVFTDEYDEIKNSDLLANGTDFSKITNGISDTFENLKNSSSDIVSKATNLTNLKNTVEDGYEGLKNSDFVAKASNLTNLKNGVVEGYENIKNSDFVSKATNLTNLGEVLSGQVDQIKNSDFLTRFSNFSSMKENVMNKINELKNSDLFKESPEFKRIKDAVMYEIKQFEEMDILGNITNVGVKILVSQDPDKVKFKLYNRELNTTEEIDIHDPESIKKTKFNNHYPTIFMTHGFTPILQMLTVNSVCNNIIDAYLKIKNRANLICVDWEELARPRGLIKVFSYPAVVQNVPIVGQRLGEFIKYLKLNAKLHVKKVHLIGFSLGAHVSGIAGQFVQKLLRKKVQRITGLDPASPAFWGNDTQLDSKLDSTDADFVDIVHTNIKANGLYEPLGHVDFYPNVGGPIQPVCDISFLKYLGIIYEFVCSHSEAHSYYAESIVKKIYACPCSFYKIGECEEEWEKKRSSCENRVRFGEKCPSTARGVYYLRLKE